MKLGSLLLSLTLGMAPAIVFGAIDYKSAALKKTGRYIDDGVFTGGKLKGPASLLNVRQLISKEQNLERVIFDIGDRNGKPMIDRPSYFHVAVDKPKKRIVIDLHNLVFSKIDQTQINLALRKSEFIESAKLRVNNYEETTHLELNLKSAVEVEAFELPSEKLGGRIALDLRKRSPDKLRK